MISIKLTYEANSKPLLIDLTSLLYDYQLLYDYYVLAMMEDYQSYSFANNFWYRTGRPLFKEDRLELYGIHYGSPLTIVTATANYIAVKVIKPLIEISGQIADWAPDRRKSKAEALTAELASIEKLADIEYKMTRNRRAEKLLQAVDYMVERERIRTEQERIGLESSKEQRKQNIQNELERRLSRNPYKLEDITIQLENREEKEE